ncbi:IS5 family transposase [Streptomyces virginiae]|uniref:IS5 family transposase n=1 Tax=Streptomyces virginiae TaxID=1961 RepID=UPI00382213D2
MGLNRAVTPRSHAAAGWPTAGPSRGDRRDRWKFQTGAQRIHLPERYGDSRRLQPATNGGHRRHLGAGVHEAGRTGGRRRRPRLGPLGRLDGRACKPARGRAPSKGAPAGEPAEHALGRSRGGLTTNIHLAADGGCRPPVFVLTAGQAGDAPAFTQVMVAIRVARPKGRPRTRPVVVLADKAYSFRAIREHLRRRRIKAVIPQPADQVANRKRLGSKGGRPSAFCKASYKGRNTVERCINKLKQWRGLATRYDKTATVYQAALHLGNGLDGAEQEAFQGVTAADGELELVGDEVGRSRSVVQ